MKQQYKKVGNVVNIAGGVKIVKVYVTHRLVAASETIVTLTTTQWLSLAGLVVFGAVAGMKAFVA